jgi:hypothetical protein
MTLDFIDAISNNIKMLTTHTFKVKTLESSRPLLGMAYVEQL